MSSQNTRLGGGGVPASAAVVNTVGKGLSAAGTTQATAPVFKNDINYVTTCASGAGVALWAGLAAGDEVFYRNGSANAMLVYPTTGAQINELAANAAFSVPAGKTAMFLILDKTGNASAFLSA